MWPCADSTLNSTFCGSRSPRIKPRSRWLGFAPSGGEALLRAFKQKFHPQWEPRYLIYPRGLGLPRIVVDVSALIAGGYRKVVLK